MSSTLWLTGLSASGKSTLALGVAESLARAGRQCKIIDGDELRRGLCADLRYSRADRRENIRGAAGGVRTARPEGALPQGQKRRNRGIYGHQRSLRAADCAASDTGDAPPRRCRVRGASGSPVAIGKLSDIFRFASRYGLSTYDAAYLELALRRGARLATQEGGR